jgi:hypothetical protein
VSAYLADDLATWLVSDGIASLAGLFVWLGVFVVALVICAYFLRRGLL